MGRVHSGISVFAAAFAVAGALAACVPSSKGTESSGKSLAASDESVAGYWKLTTAEGSETGARAPRVLRLQINGNGSRQADYCDIGGQPNEGMGQYELKDGTLTISYIGFPDVAARRRDEFPQDLTFTARVTQVSESSLVLDGTHRYRRFAPVQDPISGVLKVGICETPPPVDQPPPVAEPPPAAVNAEASAGASVNPEASSGDTPAAE